jgi:hypothetical protein
MKTTTSIYLLSNIDNDPNKVYVGKTMTSNRKREHQVRFGKQIEYTVIDVVDSLDRKYWKPLESYWIEQFRAWGFNLQNKVLKGGSGVEFHKEETKDKIRIKHLESNKRGENHHNFGKPNPHLSRLNKQKIGENHPMYGKKNEGARLNSSKRVGKFNPNSMAVHQIELSTGKVIAEYESIRLAAKATGISQDYISFYCRGLKQPKGNFTFKRI